MISLAVVAGAALAVQAPAAPLRRFEFERPAMGTTFRVVLYAPDPVVAERAAGEALDRVRAIEGALSDYDPGSELSRLAESAGTGAWVVPGPDVWRVVRLSREWSARTGGAFDITVGPLSRLWRWANRRGRAMPCDEVARARTAVGWEKLDVDEGRGAVRLSVPGMRLDAGGVGKGYAADEALGVLVRHGLPRALVDAGGDLVVGDPPPGAEGWTVLVPDLDAAGRPAAREETVRNTALATSGDRFRYTPSPRGTRLSHILDPRAGRSLEHRRVVTVRSRSGAVADIVASAASVMQVGALGRLRAPESERVRIRLLEPDDPHGDRWTRTSIRLDGGRAP